MKKLKQLIEQLKSTDWTKKSCLEIQQLALEIEEAAELAEIEINEENAKFLLKEYARESDENLSENALALKRELIDVAKSCGEIKAEMDEAATYIKEYLNEIPASDEPHEWLIRNGYRDNNVHREKWFGKNNG